ncbi:DUF4279 domain-containing protein [Leptospira sp. WS39.C2]
MKTNITPLSKKDLRNNLRKDNSNTDTLFINLCVDNLDIDPNIILKKTLIKNAYIEIKGNSIINKSGIKIQNKSNFWSIERKYKNATIPEKYISNFIKKYLIPNSLFFKKTFKNSNAKLQIIYYYYKSNNPGLLISKNTIKLLSEYSLEIELDIYCLFE